MDKVFIISTKVTINQIKIYKRIYKVVHPDLNYYEMSEQQRVEFETNELGYVLDNITNVIPDLMELDKDLFSLEVLGDWSNYDIGEVHIREEDEDHDNPDIDDNPF